MTATSPQRVVLAWWESDFHALEDGDLVAPLTPEAAILAVNSGSATIDIDKFVVTDPSLEVFGRDLHNRLHRTLSTCRPFWLEAYANAAFGAQAFQFAAWLSVLRGLKASVHPAALCVRAPLAFSSDALDRGSFAYGLAQRSFELACEVVRGEGVTVQGVKTLGGQAVRRLVKRLAASIASAPLLRVAEMSSGMVSRSQLAIQGYQPDVLLVSEQSTDAFHAAPLAARLAQVYGRRFLWVGLRPRPMASTTAEEQSLFQHVSLEDLNFVDSGAVIDHDRVNHIATRLMDVAGAWKVSGAIGSGDSLGASRAIWFELFLSAEYKSFSSRALQWKGVLDTLQPAVVVGLSTLQDMAFARAWTRGRNRGFVGLMHGAFPSLRWSTDADADYLGVFGSILAEDVTASGLPQPRRVMRCGTMQFGEKTNRTRATRRVAKAGDASSVLFVTSFEFLPFAPLSLKARLTIMRDVHRASIEAGKHLRVRTHPRFPDAAWAACVAELARLHPGTITLSTEASIASDVEQADVAIASVFNGAVVDALLLGVPVLSYLPVDAPHTETSRLMEATGGMVRDWIALRDFLRLSPDAPERVRLRATQLEFLHRYFDDLEGDPWAGALKLIEVALADSAMPARKRAAHPG